MNELIQGFNNLNIQHGRNDDNFNSFKKLFWIKNVHSDDIHCLIKINDKKMISGSKDTSIKLWTMNRNDDDLESGITLYRSENNDYSSWITALCTSLDGKKCFVGSRNGEIFQINLNDLIPRKLDIFQNTQEQSQHSYKCKKKNIDRINCLTTSNTGNLIYIGTATKFFIYDFEKSSLLSSTVVDSNDWVYCIYELNRNEILLVIGARLELWKIADNFECRKVSTIRSEAKNKNSKHQRNFISSINPLINEKSLFSMAIFGGLVEVSNIETNEIVFSAHEHLKRVWVCENLLPFVFSSCADDGFIKLWDLRIRRSIKTIKDHPHIESRVSVIKKLNDNIFISGTCPDQIRNYADKAQFSFWDVRHL